MTATAVPPSRDAPRAGPRHSTGQPGVAQFDGAALSPVLLRWLVAVTGAGLLFTIGYSIEGATRPGYNWIALPMSALALGPDGWIQRLNFALFGTLALGSALLWRRVLTPGRSAVALPASKALAGLGLIGCSIFSQDPTADYHPGGLVPMHASLHGQLHLIFSVIAITGTAACAITLARRLAVEPRWGRGWATYATATGVATMVLIALFGAVGAHGGAAGLLERLATGIDTVLGILVLCRLLSQARTGPASGG